MPFPLRVRAVCWWPPSSVSDFPGWGALCDHESNDHSLSLSIACGGFIADHLVRHGKRGHSFFGAFRAGRLWLAEYPAVDAVLY